MFKLGIDIDISNGYVVIALVALIILFMCVDVAYFVRVIGTFLYGKYFQKKIKYDETTELAGFTTTNDMDLLLNHMNNARYIREADFGRFHFFQRSGLYDQFKSGSVVQGACNIRYRKPIPIFTPFKLTTKIMYWDEKSIFFEQQFVTNDGFIRAILISQNKVVGLNAADIMSKITQKESSFRLEIPEEVKLWVRSSEVSSERLRGKTE